MTFHEISFPEDISYGSAGGPEYATDIVITQGGYEQRNINWEEARARYNVAYGVRNQAQLNVLIAFFRARKGRAYGFRFKDWADYQAIGQILAIGDGDNSLFQLTKSYGSGDGIELRNISKPVVGTVKIYLDSVIQEEEVDYSVDYTKGSVTLITPPALGVVVSADFEFDVPVRFDTDRISAVLDNYGEYSFGELPLIEIRM